MATGYLVTLGDENIDAGDVISGAAITFTDDRVLGVGSWTWSGTRATATFTDETETGQFILSTDGNTYFVPQAGLVTTITSAEVETNAADGTIDGTTGDDTIVFGDNGDLEGDQVSRSADTVAADAGNDSIATGAGDDSVDAGDGNDVVSGGAGDDTIDGGIGNDVLIGDQMTNADGEDSIIGGAGDDVIFGDSQTVAGSTAEATTFQWSTQGVADGVDISGGFSGLTANNDVRVTLSIDRGENFTSATMETTDQLFDFNGVSDTSSISFFGGAAGTATDAGNIRLDFSAGSSGYVDEVQDVTFGIFDLDEFDGQFIDQVIIRAYDADGNLVPVTLTLSGQSATDPTIIASTDGSGIGTATAVEDAGNVNPDSAAGFVQVTVAGPVAQIEIEYNNTDPDFGAHAIRLGDISLTTIPANEDEGAADSIDGGTGDDEIFGQGGDDTIQGGTGNDSIFGGVGNDTIDDSGTTTDTIDGGAGDDTITAGAGFDEIFGGAGNDSIDGENGNDDIFGGAGNDILEGGTGDDTIDGGTGNDTLSGEAGDDTLISSAGDDTSFGGTGDDTFSVTDDSDSETITGGEDAGDGDIDVVTFGTPTSADGVTVTFTGDEAGTYDFDGTTASGTFSEIERVETTDFDDTVNAELSTGPTTIDAGAGEDRLTGGTGDDSILAGSGADTIIGGAGDDAIDLGTNAAGTTPDGDADVVVLRDGFGDDTVTNFDAPTDNGDGTFTGIDTLNVANLNDTSGDPVTVSDVTVTDDGSGNAVLTFPAGESITLDGISPTDAADTNYLQAIGIPADGSIVQDGIVSGDASDNTIDLNYFGDPDGDLVDADDALLAGEANNDDIIEGLGGDDSIIGGDGDDQIFGDANADPNAGIGQPIGQLFTDASNIQSGSFVSDDGTSTADDARAGDSIIFEDAATLENGDLVAIRVTVVSISDPDVTVILDHTQASSPLRVVGTTATAGESVQFRVEFIDQTTGEPLTLSGNATIVDIDNNGGAGNEFVSFDENDITSYSVDANSSLTVAPATNGVITASGTTTNASSDEDAWFGVGFEDTTQLNFTVGVAENTANYGFSGLDLTDPVTTAVTGGNDEIDGGVGDDYIAGNGGDDTLTGGEGDDTILGGTGSDTIFGGGGDTIIGGEDADGTDVDVLNAGGIVNVTYTDETGATVTGPTESGTVTYADGSTLDFSEIESLNFTVLDGTVSGTSGDDLIDGSYTGDPEGDIVDNNDAILAGDTDNDDLIFGFEGDDEILAADGIDEVFGGDGNDSISGGDGDDTIYGDAPSGGWQYEYYDLDPTGDPRTLEDAGFINGGTTHSATPTEVGFSNSITPTDFDINDDYALKFTSGLNITTGGEYTFTTASDDGSKLFIDGVEVVDNDGHHGVITETGTVTLTPGVHVIEIIYYENNGGNALTASISGPDTNNVETPLTNYDGLNEASGDDIISGDAGDDTIFGGLGDDTILLGEGFGVDTIDGSEDGGNGDVDVLDASSMTTDATLDLSGADPENGTLTEGANVATFDNIEEFVLGSGDDSAIGSDGDDTIDLGQGADTISGGEGNDQINLGEDSPGVTDGDPDVVVLQDGFGDDIVTNFDAPTDNNDGTFTGIDTLDVTDLFDRPAGDPDRDPVNTNDVVVTDDGSGNAVLTFPNGETITLVGIDPTEADDPFYLNAIGIPLPDGTVSGGAGDDVIDGSYLGDPDGDIVDNDDAILAGDAVNDDLIEANGGNDSVLAGDGNDEVYGGTGNDTIDGGVGNDTVFGEDGDDVITGGAGVDTLFGGVGSDTFLGGNGGDVIAGGEDADGSDIDVLDLTGQGDFIVVGPSGTGSAVPDSDGNGLNGQIVFVDATGTPTGDTISFTDIETIVGSNVTNVAPEATNDTGATDEDTAITLTNVLGNDTDANNDTLTVVSVDGDVANVGGTVTGDSGGVFTINADGSASFDPDGDFENLGDGETATTTVTYTVTDEDGLEDTATVTITVNGTNDGPVAVVDTFAANEDTASSLGNVLGNDTDVEGDTLTVGEVNGDPALVGTSVAGDNGGLVTINTDGTISFDPDGDFENLGDGETATTTVTYTVTDEDGLEDTATVTITVNGTNDGPVAVVDTFSADEDTASSLGNVLGNDTDAEGDTLTVGEVNGDPALVGTSVAGDNGGLVTINTDGTISFDPDGDFENLGDGETATTSVTYTVIDEDGLEDTTTVTITVNGTNDGPVATDNAYVVTLNETSGDVDGNVITDDTGDGLDSDIDGDTVTVFAVEGNQANVGTSTTGDNGGSFTINADGTVDFDAGSDFDDLGLGETRDTSVSYTISDGNGGTSTASTTFIVTGINDGTVQGTGGDDVINPDIPYVDSDGDIVDAGDGILAGDENTDNDVIEGFGGDDSIAAGDGNDTVFGGADDDTISGDLGDDVLFGGTGNDELFGGAGDDSVAGGTGDDTIVLSNDFGNDTIAGGEDVGDGDVDVLDGSGLTDDVTVDLSAPETGTLTDGTDTLSFGEIEEIVLGSGDDSVTGSTGDDVIDLGQGTDTINAGAGNDTIDLGQDSPGNPDEDPDVVVLEDGFGDDIVTNFDAPTDDGDGTFTGIDTLDVTNLFDLPTGDPDRQPVNTADVVVTDDGSGNAVLTFPNGETITLVGIDPTEADDPFYLNAIGIPLPDGTVSGTAGDDLIDGSYTGDPDGDRVDNDDAILAGDTANDDLIIAGDGNDTIFAGDGNDEIFAGSGNDTIEGGVGNDTIDTGFGNDTAFGGEGDDILTNGSTGSLGATLFGDAGEDTLFTGTGNANDILFGGDDNDTLIDQGDESADDTFAGGLGDDSILGGGGDDTVVIEDTFGNDNIVGGEDTALGDVDVLDGSTLTEDVTVNFTGDETGTVTNDTDTADFAEIEAIITGSGDDTVIGGTGDDSVTTGAGDDVISGGAGADTFDAGDGNDTITFAEGDSIDGGDGDDTFTLEDLGEPTNGTITITGGDDDETSGGGDTLSLGNLADLSTLVQTSDGINASGNETFSGTVELDDGTTLNFSGIEQVICFTPGTNIATPKGSRPIETLRVGDMVVTRDHGLQPIRWIEQRTVPATDKFAPVRLRPGTVTGLERDLLVSPQHRMLFQGYRAELLFGESEVLMPATHLIDGKAVTREEGGFVTYIHMMFDEHEVVYAEGAASESFHPGEIGLTGVTDAAREELFTLFPQLRSDPKGYGRTARRTLKKHESQMLRTK